MDVKIYLKANSETMLRRRLDRGGKPELDYLREVVLSFYERYGAPPGNSLTIFSRLKLTWKLWFTKRPKFYRK